MSKDLANFERSVLEAADAKALAAELIAAAGHRSEFDAHAVLASHPGLARFPSIVIDLAYEEFCRHMDVGTRVDPQQFVHRFPAVADSLLKVLEVHEYLEANPDAFTAESHAAWPQAGEDIAGFTLLQEIGRGGSSRVFLAREQKLGNREVVVKISRHANGEAAWLGQLNHPHIMPVFSVSLAGATVICMPYLGCATLGDVLADFQAGTVADNMTSRRGSDVVAAVDRTRQRHDAPAPARSIARGAESWTLRRGSYVEALVKIGADLADALDYAHRQGICHCDVKPSNVLLTAEGRTLLLDFNLSMQRGGAAAVVGGTLPYMAPEQLQFLLATSPESLPAIDHRADLFSLGVTLFQLVTGKLPFAVEDLPDDRVEAARQLIERQRAQADLRAELTRMAGPEIAEVIADCLAFDRDARPTEAQQVARRLRSYLRPVSRVRRWVRQRRRAATAAALILALVGTGLAVGLASRPPYHERQFQAGVICLNAGDYTNAILCFDKTVEAGQGLSLRALLLRGWAYLQASREAEEGEDIRAGRLEKARKDFENCWNVTQSPESEMSLASYSAEVGDFRGAKDRYREAVRKEFCTPSTLNNWGYYLMMSGELEEAVDVLSTVTQAAPQLRVAHYNLAIAQVSLAGRLLPRAGDARRHGRKTEAAELESEVANAFASAIEHIEVARRLQPRSADLEFSAARVYVCASTAARDDPMPERELLDKAVSACRSALALGLCSNKLRELTCLAPQLRDDPGFCTLMTAESIPTMNVNSSQTVDIFPDILERLAIAIP